MIHGLILSREVSAPIGAYLIVAYSDVANSQKVAPAATAVAPLLGTTGKVGCSTIGQMVDVEVGGEPAVTLGGTVAAGDWLTSDGNAKAVKVTAAGQRTIGQASRPGVANDIISYRALGGVVGGA